MQKVSNIKLLLIEDNLGDARLIEVLLAKEKQEFAFQVDWKEKLSEGLKSIPEGNFDVILLDLNLPDSPSPLNTLTKVLTQSVDVPVIVLTGYDDDVFAINAVSKGAQDYLIKGKVDSKTLVRTITYAIARRHRVKTPFKLSELKAYNGKEGKPAYLAFKGNVYDVSQSKLWINGIHAGKHAAGNDLTESMAEAAHNEEVLSRVRIVGQLVKEETFARKVALRIEKLHPHPIIVHFSIAYSIAVPLFAILFFLTSNTLFEVASYYALCLGFFATPVCAASGFFSWKTSYEGKMNVPFIRKIVFTATLTVAITIGFIWRTVNPNLLMASGLGSYAYLALLFSLVPLVTVLGYYGGKITFG